MGARIVMDQGHILYLIGMSVDTGDQRKEKREDDAVKVAGRRSPQRC